MPQEERQSEWTISIAEFTGYVPSWYKNPWPSYGAKEQAANMIDVDLRDPNFMTAGLAPTSVNNVNYVDTLIKTISKPIGIDPDNAAEFYYYGFGGNTLYQIGGNELSSFGIISDGDWPHTVSDADGEGIVNVDGVGMYYFWNDTAEGSGSIGLLSYSSGYSFNDAQFSDLQYAPHQAILGGDSTVYFTNGRYVGIITTGGVITADALDFWSDAEAVSLTWNENRIKIAINRPNRLQSVTNILNSGVYTWNGYSSSWEGDPVEVNGVIGAMYTKNGVDYIWWQDSSSRNEFNFGYINGTQVKPIKKCKGTLPQYYQVGEFEGFIMWNSDGRVYLQGQNDPDISAKFFQYTTAKYTEVSGGIAPVFIQGTSIIGEELITNGGFDGSASDWVLSNFNYNDNNILADTTQTEMVVNGEFDGDADGWDLGATGWSYVSNDIEFSFTPNGEEMVTNGTFSGSAAGWTYASPWVYNSNGMNWSGPSYAANLLYQNVGAVKDHWYQVEVIVESIIGGYLYVALGTYNSAPSYAIHTSGTYKMAIKCGTETGGNGIVVMYASSSGTSVRVTKVSVIDLCVSQNITMDEFEYGSVATLTITVGGTTGSVAITDYCSLVSSPTIGTILAGAGETMIQYTPTTLGSAGSAIVIIPSADFDGSISAVSILAQPKYNYATSQTFIPMMSGNTYQISADIGGSAGYADIKILAVESEGGVAYSKTDIEAGTGTYTFNYTPPANFTGYIRIIGHDRFEGTIDNVSVIQVETSTTSHILTASYDDDSIYDLSMSYGYSENSMWATRVFPMVQPGYQAMVDKIQIYTEAIPDGATIESALIYENGTGHQTLTTIEYGAGSKTFHKILNKSIKVADFLLALKFINNGELVGKIKNILIKGHYIPEN